MAKFCGNCGAQMNDDARVCGMCGTPFAGAKNRRDSYPSRPTTETPFSAPPGAITAPRTASKTDGTLTILYLAETMIFVLLGILNFSKMFKLEFFVEMKFTLADLFEDLEAIPVIVGVILFLAAILSFIPVFAPPKKRRFIFQIIAAILPLCLLGIVYIGMQNSDSLNDLVMDQVEMLISGWLYLLLSFVAIALSALVFKKSGK